MTASIRGPEAERTIPPAMVMALKILRDRGHAVTVRRSTRSGSWFYSVDGGPERNGLQVCNRFRHYGI